MKYTIFTRKNIYPFFLNVLDKGYILHSSAIKIARKMKNKKIPLEEIIELTGLTKEEIEKL